jgi:hypothetical protein
MKSLIATLAACLMPVSLMAQVEDPHITGNVPITFYGKVVDQNNQPVPEVKVRLQVRVGYFTSPTTGKERWDPVSLETDADGKFVLSNVKGGFVQFNAIEKEGYKLLPRQAKEGYMYFPPQIHPDPTNPVVFKMWKKRGAEPLVSSSWHGKMASDGATNRFDLLRGARSDDGSLEIICKRTPLSSPPPGNAHFDYSFEIAVNGGAIQTTADEFTYLAPESGYSTSYKVAQKADDPKWWGRVTQEFYIKTADGHYGRLSVDWYASQNAPNHLDWDCSINPSGSRNLER